MLRFLGRAAPVTVVFLAATVCAVVAFNVEWTFVVGPVAAYIAVLACAGVWYSRGWRPSSRRSSPAEVLRPTFNPPAQLPPLPLFVGRGDALEHALAVLRAERRHTRRRPRIVLVTGHPGIGKTAFAIRLAHAVAGECPDGSLFARIGNDAALPGSPDDEPLTYINEFISDLKFARETDVVGQATLRELTEGKRVLFVVDDVRNESQLEPLLDVTPGCIVIATSRSRLARITWTLEEQLGPLTETEAVDLLTVMLGADGVDRVAERSGTADEVVRAAGKYPLAVRMAGIALANAPYSSLSSALERIYRLQPREVVEPSDGLDVSYALLADEERAAIDVIGALEGRILAPWMLAALMNATGAIYDDESAQRILDALVRVRFLERFSTDGAGVPLFRVHDLIMDYAQRRAGRLGPDHVAACRQSLDQARSSRRHGGLERSIVQGALAAMGRGEFDKALRLARESVSLGRENRDPAIEATGLITLAEIQAELGGTRQAEELVRAAQGVKVAEPSAQALRCTGKIDRRLRILDQAVDVLRQAVRSAIAAHDDYETVHALRELAVVHSEASRPAQGREALGRAAEIARSQGDDGDGLLPGLFWALGRVHRRAGDFDKALDALSEADRIAQRTGNRLWRAWICYENGRTRLEHGAAAEASADASAAFRLFMGMRHEYGAAYCESLLGEAMVAGGQDPADAARILEHALTTFQRCGDPWIEAETARITASVRADQGLRREAARLLELAAARFEDLGDHEHAAAARSQHAMKSWVHRRGSVHALIDHRRGRSTEPPRRTGR